MNERVFTVAVHQENGSFWAEVVELPGCFASGESLDELWEALAESIGLYLSDDSNVVTVKAVVDQGGETEISRRFLVDA